jgi:hypothetical protein
MTVTKKLHVGKIYFDNPYVLMVDFKCDDFTGSPEAYRNALRAARKLFQTTWGYTVCEFERVGDKDAVTNSVWSLGTPLVDNVVYRAYFCFSNELDAMQFCLSTDASCTHVRLWPSNKTFTIYEYVVEEQ